MPTLLSSKIDPTRSITLRRRFSQGLTRTFGTLYKEIYTLLVVEDAFGLKPLKLPTLNVSHDYASTQFDIKDTKVLERIKWLQSTLLPEDIVKLESEPHVTVRYGLYDQPGMLQGVNTLASEFGPIQMTLGKLSLFYTDKADVLKVEVESQQLRDLNVRLKLLPSVDTHPTYQPHMTLAYLKKGSGAKYVGEGNLVGTVLTFDTITYSDSEEGRYDISLKEKPTRNKRWKYTNQSEAVEEFGKWLSGIVSAKILSASEANKWRKFIERGFAKGAARAFDDTTKARKEAALDNLRAEGFVEGKREQFLRQTLSRATAVEKLKLLSNRCLSELKGATDDFKNKTIRALTEGLVKGSNPSDIALSLSKILKISKGRAETIAFTELVRAHADGQLEAMEQLGISEVGVAVEWSTATNPCKLCQPLKGIVLKISEAKGMIPRHPRCRCAWIPANVGEDKSDRKQQKRGKYKIDKAIEQSEKREERDTDWGPNKPIARTRPKSVMNAECSCSEHLTVFAKLLERIAQ